jgi:hypothetical protein
MAQEDEPDPDDRGRVLRVPEAREVVERPDDFAAVDRDREAVERGLEAVDFAGVDFARVDFAGVDFDAVDFDAVDLDAAVERVPEDARERVAAGLAVVADDEPRVVSSAVTRRARFSISPRRPRRSSSTPRSSSVSRTRVTAFATSSTISRPRALDPSGSARSTALRIASTVSGASEPFVSFFFLSFFAMARV